MGDDPFAFFKTRQNFGASVGLMADLDGAQPRCSTVGDEGGPSLPHVGTWRRSGWSGRCHLPSAQPSGKRNSEWPRPGRSLGGVTRSKTAETRLLFDAERRDMRVGARRERRISRASSAGVPPQRSTMARATDFKTHGRQRTANPPRSPDRRHPRWTRAASRPRPHALTPA